MDKKCKKLRHRLDCHIFRILGTFPSIKVSLRVSQVQAPASTISSLARRRLERSEEARFLKSREHVISGQKYRGMKNDLRLVNTTYQLQPYYAKILIQRCGAVQPNDLTT
jgi:hypothetical protein